MDLIHAAIWVSDLDVATEFYVDVLGLEPTIRHTSDDGTKNVYVRGESETELQLRYREDKLNELPPTGIDHIEFRVESTDEAFDRVVSQTDCPVVKEPVTVYTDKLDVRVAYVEDPDGYTVCFQELLE